MEGNTSPVVSLEDTNSPNPNPFYTPQGSRPASLDGLSSARGQFYIHRNTYYRSRRIIKDENAKPPKFEKAPGEKWLWINPLIGLLVGLAITGILIFTTVYRRVYHNYCPVLDDDFSSGTLNPKVWTQEVEVGGFGFVRLSIQTKTIRLLIANFLSNQQFEQTTADGENVFIANGQLCIKPTLQDENLITTNNVINLTADGTCTSNVWSNCITSTNTTNGTIVQPVKSARINTKLGATIKYGRVEVEAKIPKGDWLWPAIWMLPVDNTYGPWPASGEIDIMESRGNNHTYSPGGNDIMSSVLHWGPDATSDAYRLTYNFKSALHSEFGDAFHIYGLEWSEKYLFTYIDTTLLQVFYWDFKQPFWEQGNFPLIDQNGTRLIDPWSQTGRPQTPFDQEFYLILNVAVGGQNGWFPDGVAGKPWVDASPTAKMDFWTARDQWYPTWQASGQLLVNSVKMWQQC
jgi:beta-glucanase (GH16 family)